jgi:hypothetical protein
VLKLFFAGLIGIVVIDALSGLVVPSGTHRDSRVTGFLLTACIAQASL